MMVRSSIMVHFVGILAMLVAQMAHARYGIQIYWNSDAGKINKASDGQIMDRSFRFELGVFEGSFVPTPANTADWAENWHAAKSVVYSVSDQRFVSTFLVNDNPLPFTAGKPAYIWGFSGGLESNEWILFRAASWMWPNGDAYPPGSVNWYAKDATPIIGSINASGSPFLMQSAAVSGALPPSTSWAQWQDQFLDGEPLNGPDDDPDQDGIPNLLEFAMGGSPNQPGVMPVTPLDWVNVSGSDYLRMTIPRRKDHLVDFAVQVSSDLVDWNEGPAHVEVLGDGVDALIVRDLTPLSPSLPRRFMRVKTELPTP